MKKTQEQVGMERVKNNVILHAVIDEEGTALVQVHTHGLMAYGHTEFQVLANSLFYHSAGELLNTMAYAVIIRHEKFKPGENCAYDHWGNFTLVEKTEDGRTVLRITPLPMKCDMCSAEPGKARLTKEAQ